MLSRKMENDFRIFRNEQNWLVKVQGVVKSFVLRETMWWVLVRKFVIEPWPINLADKDTALNKSFITEKPAHTYLCPRIEMDPSKK